MNVRIMYGKYSKEENYNLFGYTYIPADPVPEKKELPVENETMSKFERISNEIKKNGNTMFNFN